MRKIELSALRRRAAAYGVDLGTIVHTFQAKAEDEGSREWCPVRKRYIPSRQMGLRAPPEPRQQPSKPLDTSSVRRWVVAVCKPSQALVVARDLDLIGFRAYCPVGRKIVYRGRTKGTARERRVHQFPLFGPYLFVGEIDDPLQTDVHSGLIGIIGDANGAWAVNPEIVRAINAAELAGTWDSSRASEAAFRRGDRVRVVDDPAYAFAGLQAIVEDVRRAGVKVNVELFGRRTAVIVPQSKLELA